MLGPMENKISWTRDAMRRKLTSHAAIEQDCLAQAKAELQITTANTPIGSIRRLLSRSQEIKMERSRTENTE